MGPPFSIEALCSHFQHLNVYSDAMNEWKKCCSLLLVFYCWLKLRSNSFPSDAKLSWFIVFIICFQTAARNVDKLCLCVYDLDNSKKKPHECSQMIGVERKDGEQSEIKSTCTFFRLFYGKTAILFYPCLSFYGRSPGLPVCSQTCCSGLVAHKMNAMAMITMMIMNIMADHVNDNAVLITFSVRLFAIPTH